MSGWFRRTLETVITDTPTSFAMSFIRAAILRCYGLQWGIDNSRCGATVLSLFISSVSASCTPYPPGPIAPVPYRWLRFRWSKGLGLATRFLRDPLQFLLDSARGYGDVVCFLEDQVYMAVHPDCVKHVLQENHANYDKGPAYAVLEPLVGRGLIAADGDLWRHQRALIQPCFQNTQHVQFVPLILDCVERAHKRWRQRATSNSPLEIHRELKSLTLEILLVCLFGPAIRTHVDELN